MWAMAYCKVDSMGSCPIVLKLKDFCFANGLTVFEFAFAPFSIVAVSAVLVEWFALEAHVSVIPSFGVMKAVAAIVIAADLH